MLGQSAIGQSPENQHDRKAHSKHRRTDMQTTKPDLLMWQDEGVGGGRGGTIFSFIEMVMVGT